MKFFKLIVLSLMLLIGLSTYKTDVSHAASTVVPGDQAIVAYNNTTAAVTVVQMSNLDFANGLDLHIQILDSSCEEVDFNHTLTKGDTDFLVLQPEDPILIDGVVLEAVNAEGLDKGIIILTAVDGPTSKTSAPSGNLAVNHWNLGFDESQNATLINAVNRDLGSDGVTFETVQPSNLLIPFFSGGGFFGAADVVGRAWTDLYLPFHFASSGTFDTEDLIGLNVFNDKEDPVSCQDFGFECTYDGAPTTEFFPINDGILDIPDVPWDFVCDKSSEDYGFDALTNSTSVDNAVFSLIIGHSDALGEEYVITADVQEAPQIDCSVDPCSKLPDCTSQCITVTCTDALTDCAEDICDGVTIDGALCVGGEPTEVACNDAVDNDGDEATDCDDSDCEGTTVCTDGTTGTGGGSSGCSVVAASAGLGSLASALVLLVPAFGIGARRIRRRLSK